MEIQELDIVITPDGEVACEVRGVKGRQCLDITAALEADLGGELLAREETHEMHEQPVALQAQHHLTTGEGKD